MLYSRQVDHLHYNCIKAFPLNSNSKVLVPDRTWVAAAHAAYNNGHKVLIVDTNKFNMNFDYTKKKFL